MNKCMNWTGAINSVGYGVKTINKKQHYFHRLMWEAYHGPIPDGYHVHHKCHNRRCFNILHLELLERSAHGHHHNKPIQTCPKCGSTERSSYGTRPNKTFCVACTRTREKARRERLAAA